MPIDFNKPIVVTSMHNDTFIADVEVVHAYEHYGLVHFDMDEKSLTTRIFKGILDSDTMTISMVLEYPYGKADDYNASHLVFNNKAVQNEKAKKILNMSEEELAEYARSNYKYSIEDGRGYEYITTRGNIINAGYFLVAGCKEWASFDAARHYYTKGNYKSTGDLEEINMIIDALERVWNKANEKPKDKWVRVLKSENNSTLELLPSASDFLSTNLKKLKEATTLDSVIGFYNMTTGELVARNKDDYQL